MRKNLTKIFNKLIRQNQGMTLVELVVCFALLAIFLTAASTAISSAVITYYNERSTEATFTVADMVLSEIREDIRTMAGNGEDKNTEGYYVKLRDSGSCIEFIPGNDNENSYMEQIDAEGYLNGYQLKKDKIRVFSGNTNMARGYLTVRYYMKNSNDIDINDGYYGEYIDEITSDTTEQYVNSINNKLSSPYTGGTKLCRDIEQRLGKDSYQGFNIGLSFELINSSDGKYVSCVKATVTIYDNKRDERYQKTEYIYLLNKVVATTDKTVYSDGPKSTSSDAIQIELTKGNVTATDWPTLLNTIKSTQDYKYYCKLSVGSVVRDNGKYYVVIYDGGINDSYKISGNASFEEVMTNLIYSGAVVQLSNLQTITYSSDVEIVNGTECFKVGTQCIKDKTIFEKMDGSTLNLYLWELKDAIVKDENSRTYPGPDTANTSWWLLLHPATVV